MSCSQDYLSFAVFSGFALIVVIYAFDLTDNFSNPHIYVLLAVWRESPYRFALAMWTTRMLCNNQDARRYLLLLNGTQLSNVFLYIVCILCCSQISSSLFISVLLMPLIK